jgi:ABC-type transporter MlaC component
VWSTDQSGLATGGARWALQINDVIIDGVSMGASERSEFASVIQVSGGQVQVSS